MAFVYRHIRKDKNTPFYIGIGKNEDRAYSKSNRNLHWNRIVSKTDYVVDILFDDINYDIAKEKEKEFINLYKRDCDGGTLCNITLGGEGALGLIHTEESKKKMGEPNKGKTISKEHRKIISKIHSGKKHSDEWKMEMSKKMSGENNHNYGRKASDSTRTKMTISSRKGEDNSQSKLTKKDVLKIRELSIKGMSQRKIASIFYVAKNTIACILNGKTWRHV